MLQKAKAVLGFSKLSPEQIIVKAQSIDDSMQNSGNFPDATRPIKYAASQAIITSARNAVVAATNGTASDTSYMHEQIKLLMMTYNLIKAYVEITAHSYTNPDSIILSAGMTVAVYGGQNAVSDLTLDAVGNGTIQIRVPRTPADKAFCFEMALANDPNNWQIIGYNSLAKFDLKNQTPGTNILIRFAAIGKTGMGAFSNSKQIMVI